MKGNMADHEPQQGEEQPLHYAENEVDRIVFLIKAALAVSLGLYGITFWEVITYTISVANMRDFFISVIVTVSLISFLATLNHLSKASKMPPPAKRTGDAPRE